ncbi:unnamed protein product [Durusdinium trenchii]|uniref:Uncharacterized protein n=1 Tax=Durusdinium trenchii TaxID=1381693 RepID=A0ABP0H6P1_9DINO
MCCEQQTPLKMLARALLPDGITGNLLGYGGNWNVAASVAEVLLPRLASGSLELHAGAKAPAPEALRRRLAQRVSCGSKPDAVRLRRPQRRHLGSVMDSLAEEKVWAAAVMDLSGLALPPHAMEFLKSASGEVLCEIFRRHGEQQDDLLWARYAEVVARLSRSLQEKAEIPGLFRSATAVLDDPAGPAPDAAMSALRTHLREEPIALQRCLSKLFERLETGGRLALLLDRRDFAVEVRSFLRQQEEVDESLVRDWRPHKVPQLFPSNGQPWAVREISEAAHLRPLATSLAVKEARGFSAILVDGHGDPQRVNLPLLEGA